MYVLLQEDVVHEDLTVRENLAYSAWLRSARHVPHRAKHDVVDDIINVLALDHIQHSVVGSAEKRGIRWVVYMEGHHLISKLHHKGTAGPAFCCIVAGNDREDTCR